MKTLLLIIISGLIFCAENDVSVRDNEIFDSIKSISKTEYELFLGRIKEVKKWDVFKIGESLFVKGRVIESDKTNIIRTPVGIYVIEKVKDVESDVVNEKLCNIAKIGNQVKDEFCMCGAKPQFVLRNSEWGMTVIIDFHADRIAFHFNLIDKWVSVRNSIGHGIKNSISLQILNEIGVTINNE